MVSFDQTYSLIEQTSLKPWLTTLSKDVEAGWDHKRWGDLTKWFDVLKEMPAASPSAIDLNSSIIKIGEASDIDDKTRVHMEELLRSYHPWRKGPFDLFGTHVDTEWRSDLKWDRLKDQITSLQDRKVLDIGSANGYHCFRMLGAGAKLAIGIEPTVLYACQFQLFQQYVQDPRVAVFPIGIDDMPRDLAGFDTVFSMGLLYHRRSPFDHLLHLQDLLRDGGELVLETIVIDGAEGDVLSPAGRYAKMPNVWFIPSVPTLEKWLRRLHFKNVRCVDITTTTSEEQRVTDWMGFQSLSDFLDPNDSSKTVEGYPAPKRAVILAEK